MSKKYPLVIMLHGKGEGLGQECSDIHGRNECNLLWGGEMHLDSIHKYPSFVVFPQTGGGDWTNEKPVNLLKGLLETLIRTYNVDLDRVYIHGLSAGGTGTWNIANMYPHLFAAVSPMSASGNTAFAPKLAYTPIWTVQGALDTNPRPANSLAIFDVLRGYGKHVNYTLDQNLSIQNWPNPYTTQGNPIYTLVPNESHVAWPTLYESPSWLAWLYAQNKNRIVVNGRTTLSPGEVAKLGISPGFDAYQWSNGATTNEITVNTSGTYRVRYLRKQYFFSGTPQWSEWSEPVTITVNSATGPVADAGKDQRIVAPESSVKLRGYGAGNNIRYQWTKVAGGIATLGGSNSNTLTLTNLQKGAYTFRLTVTDGNGRSVSDDVIVKVADANAPQSVISFTLVNADNQTDIRQINDGDVISLSTLPTGNVNIRANTDPPTVGSVKIVYDGTSKIEGGSPYTLFGDSEGKYMKGQLTEGKHTLAATPYQGGGASGTAGNTKTVTFTVTGTGSGTPNPQPNPGQAVASFTLINADNQTEIRQINDGDVISLGSLPTRNINIRVNTNPVTVGSVKIVYDGSNRTETAAPYALFGDNNGMYNKGELTVGSHTLTATPYSAGGASGTAGTSKTVSFTVTESGGTTTPSNNTGQAVASFTLINADNQTEIRQINDGDVISLGSLPTKNINIRVNTNPATVGSVRIIYDGSTKTEGAAPYSLFGDNGGVYNKGELTAGTHTLSATPYSGGGASGTAGTSKTIKFTVSATAAARLASAESDSLEAATLAEEDEMYVNAYPNPFQDAYVTVGFRTPQTNMAFYLYDQNGNMMQHSDLIGQDFTSVRINVPYLNPGIYKLRVVTDKIPGKIITIIKK